MKPLFKNLIHGWTRGCGRARRRRGLPTPVPADVESFEDRVLLSGVSFDASTGVFTVDGTETADSIEVREYVGKDGRVQIQVWAFDESGAGIGVVAQYKDDVNGLVIYGRGGNDDIQNNTSIASTVWGGAGNDTVFGGSGNDWIRASHDDDLVRARGGNDTVFGDFGDDTIYGGAGRDVISGGSHTDWIYGGSHNDTLYGGYGEDFVFGEGGNDELYGDNRYDYVAWDSGTDWLFGGAGNDTLKGGHGKDYLYGAGDNDVLDGGYDGQDDYLSGGAGGDEFVIHTECGFWWFGSCLLPSAEELPVDFDAGEGDTIREVRHD